MPHAHDRTEDNDDVRRQTEIEVEVPDLGRARASISVTALKRFWRCELAYWFAYVAQRGQPVSAGEWSLGAIVHGTLQRLFNLPPERRSFESLLELALAEWRVDHPTEYFDHLYLARSKAAGIFRVVDVQQVQVVGTEVAVAQTFGRFELKGRIDLLYRDHNGTNVVADYKTRLRWPKSPLQDPMLTMLTYDTLLSARYSSPDVATVLELLGLDPPVAERSNSIMAEDRARHRSEIARHLDRLAAADGTDIWSGRVRPSCDSCAFHDHCPAVLEARRPKGSASRVALRAEDLPPPRRSDQ
ncbi:hypothetical protein EFL26_16315 [Nocardioides pocheonensis]|uniref:PD-(D/E)XK endonuclease-like domain-containing protein n=1 Tax=Nocardioides pocheonensis TaxID=661485 RepID=A0A3N0GKK1_9ACTN|nr:hypothetical protein EFL26_16315 [Nocardioides pocheonensis]